MLLTRKHVHNVTSGHKNLCPLPEVFPTTRSTTVLEGVLWEPDAPRFLMLLPVVLYFGNDRSDRAMMWY